MAMTPGRQQLRRLASQPPVIVIVMVVAGLLALLLNPAVAVRSQVRRSIGQFWLWLKISPP